MLSPAVNEYGSIEGVKLFFASVPSSGIIADNAVISFYFNETVASVLTFDASTVESAVLDNISECIFFDVNVVSSDLRTEGTSSYGVVMAFVTVFISILRASDVDTLAILGRDSTGMVDKAVFDQVIGAVVYDMHSLRAGIVHLTV